MKRLCAFLFFIFLMHTGFSQLLVVNTFDSVYTISDSGQLCSYRYAGQICNSGYYENPFSSAVYKDTLYYISVNSSLYKMKLGQPGSCVKLTSFPISGPGTTGINALAVDKNGILYAGDGTNAQLYVYNPYTNVMQWKGRITEGPGGDMIFYKNKLLMAGRSGDIYEVNINNPPASTVFMSVPGHVFYGLIAAPFNCDKNKYYGLKPVYNSSATEMYELDLENKQLIGFVCELPFVVYDAGSNVDNGNTIGVSIDSIHISPACGNNTTAGLKVIASSASSGVLTYTIDGVITNTTGIFDGVTEGPHTLSVRNQINCSKDTSFTILHGLSTTVLFNTINPLSCSTKDGSISINATSGFPPISYSIDGGAFQSNPQFANLGGGEHAVKIKDAKGCQFDTTLHLQYQTLPTFLSSFKVIPTICHSKSGSIEIKLSQGVNPGDISTSINNGTRSSLLIYSQLDSGQHLVSVIFQNSCRYDTIINIGKLTNPQPNVVIDATPQLCLTDNGSINITATGSFSPYTFSVNNSTYQPISSYRNLPPGIYNISIADKNTCRFDTSVTILPYNLLPVTLSVDSLNPTCLDLKGGIITINVAGPQSPYKFKLNNNTYSNGEKITGLSADEYSISIFNSDLCVIDSVRVKLKLELSPECDFLHIPSAFTPNNDGLNDVFRAVAGEAIHSFRLTIYNRWGQLLFATSEKDKGWDGKFNGMLQPPGVYVWTINYKSINDEKTRYIKGTVTLLR